MKNIYEFVVKNKLHDSIKRPEKWNGYKFPKIDSIAYDGDGHVWRVLAYCSMDETEYYGKYNTVEKLLDKFDLKGYAKKAIQHKFINDTDLLVGANDGYGYYVVKWGKNGICYENKK